MTSTPRSERGEQSTSLEDSGVVRARRDHVLSRGSLTNAPYGRGDRAASAGHLQGRCRAARTSPVRAHEDMPVAAKSDHDVAGLSCRSRSHPQSTAPQPLHPPTRPGQNVLSCRNDRAGAPPGPAPVRSGLPRTSPFELTGGDSPAPRPYGAFVNDPRRRTWLRRARTTPESSRDVLCSPCSLPRRRGHHGQLSSGLRCLITCPVR